MKQSIQLRTSQHLAMTPQLQQAIRLLQLSTLELQQEIKTILETNLLLEEDETVFSPKETTENYYDLNDHYQDTSSNYTEPSDNSANSASDSQPTDLKNLDDYSFSNYSELTTNDDNTETEFDLITIHSQPLTLRNHLLWQLHTSRLSQKDSKIAQIIIDSIDEDGYLHIDQQELITIADSNVTYEEINILIHWVQSLDPAGVGARNLQECLLIQLRQHVPINSIYKLAIHLCAEHFNQLIKKDIKNLENLLHAPYEDIIQALNLIHNLNPKPGRLIAESPTEYIIPDLIVKRRDGQWIVELNPEIIPKLKVNAEYTRLIHKSEQNSDVATLKTHLQEARWFIKSLASRNDTMLRVGAKIVELQEEFFNFGEERMRPLVLRDVAEALQLHESTISRVTTQKYIYTPRGTFELKYFFSSHVNTDSGGECSSTAIRALIRKFIANESVNKPFSDEKIAQELIQRGIQVARRTVAKYREAMGIPSSNERKRFKNNLY